MKLFISGTIACITGNICLAVSGPAGSHLIFNIIGFLLAFIGMALVAETNWKSSKKTILFLTVFGMALRFLYVGYPPSDDFNRYAWEGKIQTLGINPYTSEPRHPDLTKYRDINWSGINHPEIPAVYPPLTLLLFKAASWVYPSPLPLKFLILFTELGSLLLLGSILKFKKFPARLLAWYALNPFIFIFFVGELHIDALISLTMIAALYFYQNKKFNLMYLVLGVGALIKFLPLVLLPVFVNKKNIKYALFLIFPFLLYIPFLKDGIGIFSGIQTFSSLSFNSPVHFLLSSMAGSFTVFIKISLFSTIYFIYLLIEPRIEKNCYFLLLLLLLFSSTIHPWYLCLAIPFMIFHPSLPFSLLLVFTYVFLWPMYNRNFYQGIWQENAWSIWVIWIPFFSLVVLFIKFQKSSTLRHVQHAPAKSLSIIVPTYNEETIIESFLDHLKPLLKNIPHEIIVVDAGSVDNTLELTMPYSIKVIHCEKKGRGYQIYRGISDAVNDVSVICHSDCKVPSGTFEKIISSLNNNPVAVGGWHKMTFVKGHQFKFRILEWANNIRAKYMGIAFGDQMQFIRTKEALKYNLVQNMPLMEDVNLSIELKKRGTFIINNAKIQVSSRRWQQNRVSVNALLVIKIVTVFLFLKRFGYFDPQSQYFNNQYYGKQKQ